MTNIELEKLFHETMAKSEAIEQRWRNGEQTRRNALALQKCNRRLHAITYELWLKCGKPSDVVVEPYVARPMPASLRLLDLSNCPAKEVH